VTIEVRTADGALHVRVHDDGRGGADPTGGGLAGLERRVAAADGTLRVESPRGGGTLIAVRLPGDGLQSAGRTG
jgi:signal transduction histidine kinase